MGKNQTHSESLNPKSLITFIETKFKNTTINLHRHHQTELAAVGKVHIEDWRLHKSSINLLTTTFITATPQRPSLLRRLHRVSDMMLVDDKDCIFLRGSLHHHCEHSSSSPEPQHTAISTTT
ncbi:hypothetical protein GmHk_05G014434 [Glycine max]|nr:hypothetical protein GmHk_05G014434 [Glycine max]KHM99879.1 hypothetical protein glysoja_017577 [Glycine soja]